MITIKDAVDRSNNGPLMTEKQFNEKYQTKLREIVAGYNIKLSPSEIIPAPEIGDAIFDAGVELLSSVGLYNMDSSRVLEFTKEEIIQTAKTRKNKITLGEGKNTVTFKARTVGDSLPPGCIPGPAGNPIEEQYYIPLHQSYAQIPEAQGIVPGSLLSAHGFSNISGTPGELFCALEEAKMLREVARRVGKPDMVFAEVPMSGISPHAIFASYNKDGYRKTNCLFGSQAFPDLKINWNHINVASFGQEFGIEPWTTSLIALYSFTRNPVECAVAWVAATLGMLSFNHGSVVYMGAVDITGKLSSPRPLLQTAVLQNLAMVRNVNCIMADMSCSQAPSFTHMAFYEIAAVTLANVVTGTSIVTFGLTGRGIIINGSTGLIGQMLCEAGIASAGIDISKANNMLEKLLSKYEKDLSNPPQGKTFPECYDVVSLKPTDEYKRIYSEAKEEIANIGIPFKY